MWISTKQTKHKPIDRRSFTAWAAVQSSAVINNSERRKKDENRKKTTHRYTFGDLHRSFGALQRACRRMEQGGTRPSLILQNDIGNRHSPTTIVAAITGRKTKAALPTHVKIMAKGLKTESTVLLEQIRTIDKARLGEYIHYQCWLTSWYQENANQPAQKQGQYSENHKEPDSSSVQMF